MLSDAAVGHACTCQSGKHTDGCPNDCTYDAVLCPACLVMGCYQDAPMVNLVRLVQ